MKKLVASIMTGALALSLVACGGAPKSEPETPAVTATSEASVPASAAEDAGDALDYSQRSCWYQIPEITKDVDTFYVYSTVYIQGSLREGAPEYATLDNAEMLAGVETEHATQASVYEDSTNVFVPFYRQSGIKHAADIWKRDGNFDAALSGMPYADITAALDYYFEHYNEGRPFIIAGHSQGSAIVRLVLKDYFKEHAEYYERMVAAYPIGYSITKEDLEACPHLKFATGETDTGVIISWNTEGKENVAEDATSAVVQPDGISINPLNWKLDDTYAPASENLGSLVLNEKTGEFEIQNVGADAQVVPDRGVIVTNAEVAPVTDEFVIGFLGPDSRHPNDYLFYYNNIKDNVAKRIAAYKANQ